MGVCMSDFLISVVIPTYNRSETLKRTLASVLNQSRPCDEIIVVDDGSNDNTQELLHTHYPQVNIVYQSNQGVSAARNNGIKQAKGNWLCLLDSDDSWQPDKLERQIEALSRNSEYKICHTNETWYRHGKLLNQQKKHEKRGGLIFQHCLPLCVISPSSVMIKKEIIDNVGLFDETLPACEDYDMWLRITCKYPVLFLDEALTNKFGGHDDQLSQKYWGMDRFRIVALEKRIESGDLNDIDRMAAIKMLQKKIAIFLKGAKKHGRNEYCEKFETLAKRYA